LIADYCRERQMGASLYTFGSPRVGIKSFSDSLTQKLGAENIFRVYHNNDPVSMIPMWPYSHVPNPGQVIMLPGNHSAFNLNAHFMENYVGDLAGTEWRSLRCASTNWIQRLDEEVMKWLDSGDKSILTLYGANTLWFLSKALLHVIRLAMNTTGTALSLFVTGVATVADMLCWLLEHAARLQLKINDYLARIITTLLQTLGRVVTDTADITKIFLRFVINYLWTYLSNLVRRAISMTFS
jgi:hypothetical protein